MSKQEFKHKHYSKPIQDADPVPQKTTAQEKDRQDKMLSESHSYAQQQGLQNRGLVAVWRRR